MEDENFDIGLRLFEKFGECCENHSVLQITVAISILIKSMVLEINNAEEVNIASMLKSIEDITDMVQLERGVRQ